MTRSEAKRSLRDIPSVDRVLRELGEIDLPRPLVVAIVRRELALVREMGITGTVMAAISTAIENVRSQRIGPVINGTGIIIHTNLGRSPMGPLVVQAIAEAASNYINLEFDLIAGERGGRASYVEFALAALCDAPAATVVNNCAAALILMLRHFASTPPRNQVIISRGQLVQIGGGFRIPEILEASGAVLREVGTTNRTTLDDYRRAIDDRTGMILCVHQSNFFMEGFVDWPATAQIAALARQSRVPFAVDLGSGATFETADINSGEHEPTPAETLAAGAELVAFSGDKLLGGPQAGIIAGAPGRISALKREPFFRALRCDKLVLAALQVTAELLLADRMMDIPLRAAIAMPTEVLASRAHAIIAALSDLPIALTVGSGVSQIGGGALPRSAIPSITIELPTPPHGFVERLRRGAPPVIGYISSDRFKLDLRTIFPAQDAQLIAALRAMASAIGSDRS
jgi:L-seryl-tRNA(Ser) seleniumtransferase